MSDLILALKEEGVVVAVWVVVVAIQPVAVPGEAHVAHSRRAWTTPEPLQEPCKLPGVPEVNPNSCKGAEQEKDNNDDPCGVAVVRV